MWNLRADASFGLWRKFHFYALKGCFKSIFQVNVLYWFCPFGWMWADAQMLALYISGFILLLLLATSSPRNTKKPFCTACHTHPHQNTGTSLISTNYFPSPFSSLPIILLLIDLCLFSLFYVLGNSDLVFLFWGKLVLNFVVNPL